MNRVPNDLRDRMLETATIPVSSQPNFSSIQETGHVAALGVGPLWKLGSKPF